MGKRELPKGWEFIRLGFKEKYKAGSGYLKNGICNIKIGGTPPRTIASYFEGDNIWVSVRDLNGKELFDSKEKITDLGVEKSNVKLIKKGTTLVCFKLSLGKKAIAGNDLYTNEAIAGLEINNKFIDKYLNKYIFYYMDSLDLLKYSSHSAKGNSINSTILNELPFLSIPKTEQQKIVDYLDENFASIDNIEKEVEEYENKLDELEKGILKDVFENIEGEEKVLGELFDITSSKRIYKSDYVEKGIPFYRSKEIIEKSKGKSTSINYFIDENKFNEIDKKFGSPKEGDILITAVGTIGITYIVKDEKFYFKDGNLIWLKNKNLVSQNFIDFYLNSYIFTDFALGSKGGAVYSALTIDKLKKFKIKYPDINTQKEIAYKLDKQFELIQSTRDELEKQKVNLKNLRKSILNDVFGGFED